MAWYIASCWKDDNKDVFFWDGKYSMGSKQFNTQLVFGKEDVEFHKSNELETSTVLVTYMF